MLFQPTEVLEHTLPITRLKLLKVLPKLQPLLRSLPLKQCRTLGTDRPVRSWKRVSDVSQLHQGSSPSSVETASRKRRSTCVSSSTKRKAAQGNPPGTSTNLCPSQAPTQRGRYLRQSSGPDELNTLSSSPSGCCTRASFISSINPRPIRPLATLMHARQLATLLSPLNRQTRSSRS